MPNPKKVNKLQCRYCKGLHPNVEIKHVKGKPVGECRNCNRNQQQQARVRASYHLGLYKSVPELVQANTKTLKSLADGTYALIKTSDNSQVGYITLYPETICINVYQRLDLFHYELFGISSYLGNLNVFIDTRAAVETSGSRPAIDESMLASLTPIDVQERLIWLDRAYEAKAMKILRAELADAKRANVAIARAKAAKA